MLNFGDLRFTTELEVIAHGVHYTPERPAPYSCNHDSPRFSDPGENEECEAEGVSIVLKIGDKEFSIPLPHYMTDYLASEILAVAYEHHQNLLKEI